jgi:four helix bundle protein
MATYRDLEVYKRSYRLALEVHTFSLTLPKYLQYDIGDQIRRCSRSIPSDIAEGYARKQSAKDTLTFLNRAQGSLDEVLFNLEFLKDTRLISQDKYDYFLNEYTICSKQLTNLVRSLKNN